MMCLWFYVLGFFFFKQKTAYEMRISDWSSDVCSSDLDTPGATSYYRETREVYTVLSSTHMMALSSDWFVVRASIGKLELHEAAAPGAEGVVIDRKSVV